MAHFLENVCVFATLVFKEMGLWSGVNLVFRHRRNLKKERKQVHTSNFNLIRGPVYGVSPGGFELFIPFLGRDATNHKRPIHMLIPSNSTMQA
jgi:hypothetical protein